MEGPVPSGLSSPIVVGDKLVITAFENDKLYTIAYNRADGSEAWRAEAPAKKIEPYYKAQGSPAASSCATDGERIVSYFGSCGLFCYDLAGKELWRYEMPPAETIAGFGTGNSPVIVDGLVILDREEIKDPKIIALDLATGKPKWEKKRESNSSFGTPADVGDAEREADCHAGLQEDDRLQPGERRRGLARRRDAVRLLHDAGDGRRQVVLRRLVAGRSGGQGFPDAELRRHS